MDVVKVPLKRGIYINYLRSVFGCPEGAVVINRSHDSGRVICATRAYADVPGYPDWYGDFVLLDVVLPQSDNSQAQRHFVVWTREGADIMNDLLEVMVNTYFGSYMFMATNLGIQRKDALAAFMTGLNADDDEPLFDRYKKRDYRFRVGVSEFLDESLRLAGVKVPQRILRRRKRGVMK